jgi:hypothetical protein
MMDINNKINSPAVNIFGRRVLQRNLAIWYAGLSFLIIFTLGLDMGGATIFPFAVLYSWAGLLAGRILLSPLEILINRYGMDEKTVAAVLGAILLFASLFFYLMILFRMTKLASRISRAAGLMGPLLFHFLGSLLLFAPHPRPDLGMYWGWRDVLYYASCALSLALALGYVYISWLIAIRAVPRKASS